MSSNEELELTFALKHIDQHLLQNDFNTKKLLKLQQRIILKEKSNVYFKLNQMISCKGAVKIYQAYESLLQDIQNNINTIDHALRLCSTTENDGEESFKDIIDDIEMDYNSEAEESKVDDHEVVDNVIKNGNNEDLKDDKKALDSESPLPLDTLVAALTLTAEGSNEWILARIKGFSGEFYTVEDAEIEEEPSIEIAQKEVYKVDPSHIKLIPETEDAALSRVEFRLKQNVLALFPGTTCFYSSIVMSQPSRRKKTRDYLLKFADDDVPSRPCAARYVLPFPNN